MRLFLFVMLVTPLSLVASDWQKVSKNDGIRVYKKESGDSGLITVKATVKVAHSLEQVLTLMVDQSLRHLWVDRLRSIKRIKQINGVLDAISYYQVDFPWPASDRDFVVRTKIWYDQGEKTVKSETHSVMPEYPAQKGYIRAESHKSHIYLKNLGQETEIMIEARVDPKGRLPKFLVNYFQTRWAHETLARLREVLKKTPIKVLPEIDKLLAVNP